MDEKDYLSDFQFLSKGITLECLKLTLERAQIPKEYKAEIVGSKIIISKR